MDDDWRLQIDLEDEGAAGKVADLMRSNELENELEIDLKQAIAGKRAFVQALPEFVRGRSAVYGLVAQGHAGLGLGAQGEGCADVRALAQPFAKDRLNARVLFRHDESARVEREVHLRLCHACSAN